eukprot:COSAG02_NODE_59595_length_274_cov_0.508571_1_plen_24_part_01
MNKGVKITNPVTRSITQYMRVIQF